jgi:hypothetical protein
MSVDITSNGNDINSSPDDDRTYRTHEKTAINFEVMSKFLYNRTSYFEEALFILSVET